MMFNKEDQNKLREMLYDSNSKGRFVTINDVSFDTESGVQFYPEDKRVYVCLNEVTIADFDIDLIDTVQIRSYEYPVVGLLYYYGFPEEVSAILEKELVK